MTRLLLLARHYPPAVSGGARRPFLLARALREMGADVFTVAPSLPEGEFGFAVAHPNRDPSSAPAGRPALRDRARELLLWPDPDIRWTLKAANAAAAHAPWTPDWIWTSAPPESLLAGGLFLKKRFGARWFVDFRDHWLDRPHRTARTAPLRRIGERLLAQRWIPQADLIACVDQFVCEEMRLLGARDPKILPHFAPPEIATIVVLPLEALNLVHAGSIILSDPEARIADLLGPFEKALAENPQLKLHFVGRLSADELAIIDRSPARHRIAAHGVRTFAESLGFQSMADGLILLGSRKTRVPPSKIVEYLETDRPIFIAGEGSWRSDPRLTGCQAIEALAKLTKGARRKPGARAPSAAEVARLLASWLGARHELQER